MKSVTVTGNNSEANTLNPTRAAMTTRRQTLILIAVNRATVDSNNHENNDPLHFESVLLRQQVLNRKKFALHVKVLSVLDDTVQ